MMMRCAWAACTEQCDMNDLLPVGWTFLITFREPTATPGLLDFKRDRVIRDAVLCRVHAVMLEELLIPL